MIVNWRTSWSKSEMNVTLAEKPRSVLCVAFIEHNLGIRQISSYLRLKGFSSRVLILPSENKICEHIAELQSADIVGVSFVTDDFPKARHLGALLKEGLNPRKPLVVFGGAHPTIRPEECLRHCDVVVRGEGEDAMLEICANPAELDAVKNVSFLRNGRLVNNDLRNLESELDRYPFPDYSGVNNTDKYFIMTSRGCPFNCSYCYNNYKRTLYHGRGRYLREHSIDYVIRQLQQAKMQFQSLRQIEIYDDNFFARDLVQLRTFCREYKDKIGLPFFCLANPVYVNEQKLQILKDAGLERLQIGIQTGSERLNSEVYGRRISNEKILEVAELCKKFSISVFFDLIFNNPYETKTDLRKTLKLVLALPRPLNLQGFNLVFYPNTKITGDALKDGYISPISGEQSGADTIQAEKNSPLFFGDDLKNSLWVPHFSSRKKMRLNNLIALSPHLPVRVIRVMAWLPGNMLFWAKAWLKLSKRHTPSEQYLYSVLFNDSAVQDVVQVAREKVNTGLYAEAASVLKDLLSKGAVRSAAAYYFLAFSLQQTHKEHDSILKFYAKALALGFDEYWVRFNRSQYYYRIGDKKRAISDMKKALVAKPDDKSVSQLLKDWSG